MNISSEGLLRIAASRCGQSLRSIKAKVEDESQVAIHSICQACPGLRDLSLQNNSIGLDGDFMAQTVAQCCPLIEVLATQSWRVTDTSLNTLATIHTLKELKLRNGICASAAIQAVLQSNPNITSIDLFGEYIDDALVRSIGRYCGSLKSLELFKRGSPALIENGLCDIFRGCPLLEVVDLCPLGGDLTAALRTIFVHCHFLFELEFIVVDTLNEGHPPVAGPILYTHFPSLTKLKVACDEGEGITSNELQNLFTYCSNLREIHINHCDNATDETIKVITQNCRNLDAFCLVFCKNVSIAGVMEVATHCTKLTSLHLTFMPISDEILIQLSRTCLSLTNLSLFNCGNSGGSITETGVLAVVERCTGLTFVTIHGNMPFIPNLDLAKLRLLYPHIKLQIGR